VVLITIEQPLHPLLGVVLLAEVLHLLINQFNQLQRRESMKFAELCRAKRGLW
jgi:hypothetical protein